MHLDRADVLRVFPQLKIRILSPGQNILRASVVGFLIQKPGPTLHTDGITAIQFGNLLQIRIVSTACVLLALEVLVLIEDDLQEDTNIVFNNVLNVNVLMTQPLTVDIIQQIIHTLQGSPKFDLHQSLKHFSASSILFSLGLSQYTLTSSSLKFSGMKVDSCKQRRKQENKNKKTVGLTSRS